MMLPEVTAIRFEKVMGSGRTQPCLMVCEDTSGEEVELVVKLRGHPQIAPGGLMAEAMASLLALDLDLPVPPPYQVRIEREFADTVPDASLREVVLHSQGVNFGSAKWKPGYTIWPRDKRPSREMRQTAMEVFAFDGIIQNPDRRAVNPNCVYLGDDLLLYDHESAFTHFFTILPKPPWEPGGVDFLKDHIFWPALRGETLELDRLQGALEVIDADRINEYLHAIPGEWDGQAVTGEKIRSHLLDSITNFKRIQLQLQATL
jgi:hypothetical protein